MRDLIQIYLNVTFDDFVAELRKMKMERVKSAPVTSRFSVPASYTINLKDSERRVANSARDQSHHIYLNKLKGESYQ